MRRHGNLWEKITDAGNIRLAYAQAKRHKPRLRGVLNFDKNREANLAAIRQALLEKTFHTSPYFEKVIYEN